MSMAPSRASATTSASSARVPQFEKITEVSSGTPPKRIGNVPPASPSSETCPPGATAPAASASVSSLPTQSTTSAAPRPPAARRSSRPGRPRPAAPRRPAARRHLECLVATVDGDDARRAERLQELDGDVTEPADADHDRARPGASIRARGGWRGRASAPRRPAAPRRPGRARRAEREAGEGTTMYSASPPSRPSPAPRACRSCSQRCSAPTLQAGQRPHPHGP